MISDRKCDCGCGEFTNIALTNKRDGTLAGQPYRFVRGHHWKAKKIDVGSISTHECECGCGEFTKISSNTNKNGAVRGQPTKFVRGHASRKPRVPGESEDEYITRRARERSRERYKNDPEFRKKIKNNASNHREKYREKYRSLSAHYREQHIDKYRQSDRKSRGLPEPTRPSPDVCEVCSKPPITKLKSGKTWPLCLDHSHTTGKFRGWLCSKCNSALGMANDDIFILKKLATYLENFQLKEVA
jgi:hypothetical protein